MIEGFVFQNLSFAMYAPFHFCMISHDTKKWKKIPKYIQVKRIEVNSGLITIRDVRIQIWIWFQTFFSSSQNPIFRLLMQFECIEKHIFSGISDYFRLFLTDALTPLNTAAMKTHFIALHYLPMDKLQLFVFSN